MSDYSIEYSIVSRGTEKYNNIGYMAITEIAKSYRYILNYDHGIKKAPLSYGYLKAKDIYNIYNIAFSRFQLITALMYNKHKKEIKDKILLLGIGNLGISCLFYLLDNNYKSITIFVRKSNPYYLKLAKIIKKEYNINIDFVTEINNREKYNTYIDTTGSSTILKNIFEIIEFNKTIIILSTPRDEKYLISPLMINRKSITIIGGHEFNGITNQYRQKVFNKLLSNNQSKKYLKNFISEYNYSIDKLESIKTKKENYIEIFHY